MYLLPAPLWPGTASTFITSYHRQIIQNTPVIATENTHRAASFLRAADPGWQPSQCYFFDAAGKDPSETREFLDMVEKVGAGLLISDAGMPCIADPGHHIVRQAHQRGIRVTPLPGPVSFIMALAASGLSGQYFCFLGYPPRDKGSLVRKVTEIGQALFREPVTTYIFMETPQRAQLFLEVLTDKLPLHAMLCLVQGLQSPEESIRTLSVADWRNHKPSLLSKMPCVFLIGQ